MGGRGLGAELSVYLGLAAELAGGECSVRGSDAGLRSVSETNSAGMEGGRALTTVITFYLITVELKHCLSDMSCKRPVLPIECHHRLDEVGVA